MAIHHNNLLLLLESRNHSLTCRLMQNGFHFATVSKLRKNERINTDTINRLYELPDCRVKGDPLSDCVKIDKRGIIQWAFKTL